MNSTDRESTCLLLYTFYPIPNSALVLHSRKSNIRCDKYASVYTYNQHERFALAPR